MNKLELVQAFKDSNGLSKSEADAVVNLFSSEIATALAKGNGLKSEDSVQFTYRNTNRTPGVILRWANGSKSLLRSCRFFKVGRELRERVDV